MTSLWDYQSSTLMSSVQSSPVFTPKDEGVFNCLCIRLFV